MRCYAVFGICSVAPENYPMLCMYCCGILCSWDFPYLMPFLLFLNFSSINLQIILGISIQNQLDLTIKKTDGIWYNHICLNWYFV